MASRNESPNTSRTRKILLWTLVFVSVTTWTVGQECGTDRQSRCRSVVLEELDSRSPGLSSQGIELHCRSIRQNINCLVWQLTHCSVLEAERNGAVINRGWKYLRSMCDTYGGWWQNKCFQKDELKLCEKGYKGSRGSESCSDYDVFRDCVMDVVERRCDSEDRDMMGTYLLEKAGEMIWRCSGQRRLTQRISGPISPYSAAVAAESPYVPHGCNARSSEEIRGCLDRYQFERDQSFGTRDEEELLRRSCCASWNYKDCVQNAFRSHCYDNREVHRVADVIEYDSQYRCKSHWIYTCSGATKDSAISFVSVVILVVCTVFTKMHMLV